ncbi:MAG: thermosome subunit beta [Candidatus Njordarchaeia archaeon]
MASVPTTGAIPILVLKEDIKRERGKRALFANIAAAKSVAEIVRSTLGPRGLNKMLVDSLGDIIITNDGATILDELDVAHPAAKLIVQASKAQDDEAGDGTTSTAIFTGELLTRAEKLIERGIHPIIVINAYRKAYEKAKGYMEKNLVKNVDIEKDVDLIKNVAVSALNSKLPEEVREKFAELAYRAAKIAYDSDRNYLDLELISILQKEGKSLEDTELVEGVVVDKKVVSEEMPKIKRNAKIALINQNIEVEKADVTSNITLSSLEALDALKEKEREQIEKMVGKLVELGVGVLFCQRGISDQAQDILAKHGIMAIRRVRRTDMLLLSKATGAKIVNSLDDLDESDLGYAGLVEERKVGEDKVVYVKECKNPKAATIIIRGSSKHVTDEAERAVHDALMVMKDVFEDKMIVPGAGAAEVATALYLEDWAQKDDSLTGKEKEAVLEFANALLAIPKTLIENMGGDTIELLGELRKKNADEPGHWGFNAISGEIVNVWDSKLVDPYRVKRYIISTGSDAAITILRIDDVIASKPKKEEKKGQGGGMPGGMPGGEFGGGF